MDSPYEARFSRKKCLAYLVLNSVFAWALVVSAVSALF